MIEKNTSRITELGSHDAKYLPEEKTVVEELCAAFEASPLSLAHRLKTFPRHVRRQDVARFLTRYEVFKVSLPAHGSVVECGVFSGGGLLSWSHFSAILEPYNHTRRVIGFDTFEGFPDVHEEDARYSSTSEHLHAGGLKTHAGIQEEIEHLAALQDRNRPLGHIPKVELVAGDASQTIPHYVQNNPHLLVSLLYLDFDIYEPTRVALEHLYPRVVQGGVVAFDELNSPEFPSETTALLKQLDLARVRLCRLPFDPYISYFVKE